MNNVLIVSCHNWTLAALIMTMATLTVSCDNTGQPAGNNSAPIENAQANIKFSQDTVQAKSGADVVVTVLMGDLPTTEGGGISLTYDSSMVSVSAIQVNQDTWKFVNNNGAIDNAAGKVSDVLFSNYSAVSGNAEIATMTIRALRPGNSRIVLSGSAVNPFASNGETLNVSFGQLQVNAAAN